jgi:hypothetical protein
MPAIVQLPPVNNFEKRGFREHRPVEVVIGSLS